MRDIEPSRPRVFVVDDDAGVRDALSRLLRSADYEVRGFSSADEFLAGVRPEDSGCLVLDVNMPGVTGPELHRELRAQGYSLPVIFLTGHGDVPTSVEAMKRGAFEFLLKPVEDDRLLDAIGSAHERAAAIRAAESRRDTALSALKRLTGREREVLDLVAAGRLNKQIAATLGISEKTVKVHRHGALQKLGIRSVAELVRLLDSAGARTGRRATDR
jgi:RNA polymerase sigma factor (sigma-70 family)